MRPGMHGGIQLASIALCACTLASACVSGPHPARSEEAAFPSGGLELRGTLRIPEGKGPHPAIVLAHGSGPSDRNEAMPGQLGMLFGCSVRVFEELAVALSERGYAVLSFDKRTCGPFNGCADNDYPAPSQDLVIEDLIADVAAASAWLGERGDVDPERIYIVGHSEGGTFAPRLLTDETGLRGAVMLAAPHSSVDALLAQQLATLERLLAAMSVDDATQERALAELREMRDDVAALRAGVFQGEAIGGVEVGFWRSWLALGDEAPALAAASDKPLLALFGDYDWNVLDAEAELWRGTFSGIAPALRGGAMSIAQGDQPEHEVAVLPCVTHALNCITEQDLARLRPAHIGCHVHGSVIDAISSFLDQH
jgi:dienelactone hydrolase